MLRTETTTEEQAKQVLNAISLRNSGIYLNDEMTAIAGFTIFAKYDVTEDETILTIETSDFNSEYLIEELLEEFDI